MSTDRDLEVLIVTLKQSRACTDNMREVLNVVLTISVGEELLRNKVLHLPVVHDHFQEYATELAAASHLDEEGTVKSVSSTWLLSGLTANLNHHMAYSCKTRNMSL